MAHQAQDICSSVLPCEFQVRQSSCRVSVGLPAVCLAHLVGTLQSYTIFWDSLDQCYFPITLICPHIHEEIYTDLTVCFVLRLQ